MSMDHAKAGKSGSSGNGSAKVRKKATDSGVGRVYSLELNGLKLNAYAHARGPVYGARKISSSVASYSTIIINSKKKIINTLRRFFQSS